MSIMARGAVLAPAVLAMAAYATTHVMLHRGHCYSRLGYVPVTRCTIDFSAIMRSMPELDERFAVKSINALPRHFYFLRSILAELLHPRFIGRQLLVT